MAFVTSHDDGCPDARYKFTVAGVVHPKPTEKPETRDRGLCQSKWKNACTNHFERVTNSEPNI